MEGSQLHTLPAPRVHDVWKETRQKGMDATLGYLSSGAGIMEADDRQMTSALGKPSIMKRYHRRRTTKWGVTARSPTMVTLHDTGFVECRWWNDGWTVKTVVTWRSSASMIPGPGYLTSHRGGKVSTARAGTPGRRDAGTPGRPFLALVTQRQTSGKVARGVAVLCHWPGS